MHLLQLEIMALPLYYFFKNSLTKMPKLKISFNSKVIFKMTNGAGGLK